MTEEPAVTFATSYPSVRSLTAVKIPCCVCGVAIFPNAANQCASCLAQTINLQEALQQGPGGAAFTTIHQCRMCRRFQQFENVYISTSMESNELLAICLKKIPALSPSAPNRLSLIDAGWIWTEPHSMRLKLHLTVRSEVLNVTVEQRCKVELHIQFLMCPECNREFTNRTWQAVVQVRQDRPTSLSKSGLLVLEQAIAKNKSIRKHVLRIDQPTRNGFDFYFISLPHALTFTAFLQRVAFLRMNKSQKLVSTDARNNTTNTKHTLTCDLVPICRYDLLVIHKNAAKAGCLAGRLALVAHLSSVLHLVDAAPKNNNNNADPSRWMVQVSPDAYYRNEKSFTVLQSSNRLVRFVVLDVELAATNKQRQHGVTHDETDNEENGAEIKTAFCKDSAHRSDRYALAEVVVARESDFGFNNATTTCVTHLGHLLAAGDIVLGYDLTSLSLAGGAELELQKALQNNCNLPDVVLVKKAKSTTSSAAQTKAAMKDNDDNDDDVNAQGKPRISKKKDRRRRRKEGKRRKEMEESAIRMGFLDDQQEDEQAKFASVEEEEDGEADHFADEQFLSELAVLERDIGRLDTGDGMKSVASP